jgi:hypothetical protein
MQARLYPYHVGSNLPFIRAENGRYTWLNGLNSDASLGRFLPRVPYAPDGLTGRMWRREKRLHPFGEVQRAEVRKRGAQRLGELRRRGHGAGARKVRGRIVV